MKRTLKKQILFFLVFGITTLHTFNSSAISTKEIILKKISSDQAVQATSMVAGGLIGGIIGYKLMQTQITQAEKNIYLCAKIAGTTTYGLCGAFIGLIVHKKLIKQKNSSLTI